MRFLTYEAESNSYEPQVMSEADFHALSSTERATLEGDIDCYVWQEAESAELALSQHVHKHEEWEADVNSGRIPKDTY